MARIQESEIHRTRHKKTDLNQFFLYMDEYKNLSMYHILIVGLGE